MSIRRKAKGSLGQALRRLRVESKKTIMEVADEVGVSKQTISKFELGKAMPTGRVLCLLAKSLGASEDALHAIAGQIPTDVETLLVRPAVFRLIRACEPYTDAEVDRLATKLERSA